MNVIEHHIQREIIDRLMRAKMLRFSELKPQGMESNIFMYHLNQLIKCNFIAKTKRGYILAPPGLMYVDNLSSVGSKPKPQPKLICIMIVRDRSGRWLLAERKIQPFIGKFMLPSGKQRLGESIEQHVKRELQEKLGIQTPAIRKGVAEIILCDKISKNLLTHVIGQVYEVVVEHITIPPEADRYRYSIHKDAAADLSLLPGTKELINAVENTTGQLFFFYSNLE